MLRLLNSGDTFVTGYKKNYYFVFCLAGLGIRFKEAGFKVPKYLLQYNQGQSTIINEIICSFNLEKNADMKILCNKRDIAYRDRLEISLSDCGINYELIYINDTCGQAETAFLATEEIKKNEPEMFAEKTIIFFNGDTILKSRNLNKIVLMMEGDLHGVIDCFYSKKENYSYVITDSKNYVTDIKEKKVISNNATSGLYAFSNSRIFSQEYSEVKSQIDNSEIYISDIYKNMLLKNIPFKAHLESDNKNTIVLGTPAEYLDHLNAFQK